MTTQRILEQAKNVKKIINIATTEQKNQLLEVMAQAIMDGSETILIQNQVDMDASRGIISDVMLDRLLLTQDRLKEMAQGLRDLVDLEDPVGKILEERAIVQDLALSKISVPLGVVGIIYESRPNVTSDAAGLAIKSGNACVLRSGKEAFRTAQAIVIAMQKGIEAVGFPKEIIQLITDTSRQSANEMMKANGYIDVLIPRGGKGLIQAVVQNATVPIIETGTGIVHIYVDQSANQEQALTIIHNAKTSRPSVCNACEVILVHQAIAAQFLPKLYDRLVVNNQPAVELRLDTKAGQWIQGQAAKDAIDFDTEFSDYILAVKVVDSTQEAIDHIEAHGTHHSDAILSQSPQDIALFTQQVDSAAVYVNASTRFTDGGQFGLGCEMGISTQKLHARGPMGLAELTTYKYIVTGDGQIR